MAEQRDTALLELSSTQDEVSDTRRQLHDVQQVLAEMERESGKQESEHRMNIDRTTAEMQSLQAQIAAQISQWRHTAEVDAARIRQLMTALEERDIDLRMLRDQMAKVDAAKASTSKAAFSGKQVDQILLKNLIIGYITTPDDKKADLIPLLGAILEFDKDDMNKVHKGAHGNTGWFSFIRGGGAAGDYSIAAQFIKFLENESTKEQQGQPATPGGAAVPMLNVDTRVSGV